MRYYFTKNTNDKFSKARDNVIEALKNEGFGILTEINVKETLREKLNIDFRNYLILGACNPSFAYKALQVEEKVGTMLPCNIIIQEKPNGSTEVSAVDPLSSMQSIDNKTLKEIAKVIQGKLKKVINNIQ